MNFTLRRKPFALFLHCAFASMLISACATEARAQASMPLRVDPALLGLPPIKPAEVPAPAPVEKARAEIRPIEEPVVETRPIEARESGRPVNTSQNGQASAQETPASPPESREAVPPPVQVQPAKASLQPVPAPPQPTQPAIPLPQATVSGAPTPAQSAVQQQAPALAEPLPATAPSSAAAVAPLAPLRVDPALLGLPPVTATAATSQATGVAPATPPARGGVVSSARVPGDPATLAAQPASADRTWYQRFWDTLVNPFNNGSWEHYLPLKTYHSRGTYTQEQIDSYQENPPGYGIGKGLYNEHGNREGVYLMGFQDSHYKPSYMAGYGWQAIWRPVDDVRVGLGYNAGLMTRSDMGYIPFPVILPVASIGYKNLSFEATLVPPFGDKGNVLFVNAKWEMGKKGEAIGTPAKPAAQVAPTQFVNTSFGASTPREQQRVPYGPALEAGPGAQLVSSAQTIPPVLPATGPRDEIEVPDPTPALALRATKEMQPVAKDNGVSRPVFLSAYRMGGEIDREFNAEGEAELRKIGTALNADRLTYWPTEDEVEAEGSVRLEQGEDVITGPKMRLKLEDQVGFFEQPSYTLKRQPLPGSKAASDKAFATQFTEQQAEDSGWNSGFAAPRVLNIKPGQTTFKDSTKAGRTMTEARGEADRIDFEGENQVRMTNATYTTCAPGNDDWYAKAGVLKLDYDREVGEGKDGTVYFKGVPILYSPWLSFPLNNERKSGFLAPTTGSNSDNGFQFSLPYYWNIAPNMDATIAPNLMTKRGVQLKNEFRYLDTAFGGLYRGQARVDVLPDDRLRNGENRYGYSLQHTQATANGFSGLINYNKVSDDNYYTDLSSSISSTSKTQLLQQGMFSYGGGGWWNASVNFQQYQTLQPDPENPVLEAYRMMPQITVNARKPDFYQTDSSFMGQYTAFSKPKQVINGITQTDPDGQRTVLYPQVALPYVTPGWYITPKLGLNVRNYSITGQVAGFNKSISTTLPIASVDSGMTFERSSNWFGRDYTQTLEPRLYYLNVPYKNQSNIPIFDTALADFNFAQIFSQNQYSGWDRISNANQLTTALTTRLLEPSTGSEIMRAMVGQIFYFAPNKVTLPSATTISISDQKWQRSDFLAAFSGQILPRVYADTAVQYNLNDQQVQRYSFGARYQPEPGKVLNTAYRYNRDPNAYFNQVDVSGQWPLSGRWHAVGRINYSLKDEGISPSTTSSQNGRLIESIAGLEYNGGCWVVRGVVRRLALTEDTSSTSFFIQLELNDFSRIGSNPLNLLKRNIQGYGLINQPVADPVFGE